MPCTVTGEGEVIVAAGRGDKQNKCAHDDLRAGGHRAEGRRSGSRDGGDRISGLGHLRATAAATATTMSRAATAGWRREAIGSDFRAGSGGGLSVAHVLNRKGGVIHEL